MRKSLASFMSPGRRRVSELDRDSQGQSPQTEAGPGSPSPAIHTQVSPQSDTGFNYDAELYDGDHDHDNSGHRRQSLFHSLTFHKHQASPPPRHAVPTLLLTNDNTQRVLHDPSQFNSQDSPNRSQDNSSFSPKLFNTTSLSSDASSASSLSPLSKAHHQPPVSLAPISSDDGAASTAAPDNDSTFRANFNSFMPSSSRSSSFQRFSISSSSAVPPSYEAKTGLARIAGRLVYSFRFPEQCSGNLDTIDHPFASVVEKAATGTAAAPLTRGLKARHIQMIAYGGSIGTGLFITSGKALSQGGPAALLIGFALTGVMLLCTLQALGELAVCFPVSGAFSTYATRFLDPAWGFALGWNYFLQWTVAFPLELVAASLTIQFWSSTSSSSKSHGTVGGIPLAAWVAIFWVVIVSFNLFGVHVYGETEFVFSALKIIALVAFIVLGIVLVAGGSPNSQGYIGGTHWHDPGAFSHGFKGVCSVFVSAAFSYSGSELSGLTAAEAKNPRRSIPSAIKQVCWRVILLYFVSLTLIGFLVPHDDPRLMSGTSDYDATASPFVIAIKNAGIGGLPSVFNAAILIAVLSVANSSVYASTRTLAALAAQGMAPKQLGYIDNAGRPVIALAVVSSFGALAFAAGSDAEVQMFQWLMAMSGLSCVFTWLSVCLSHIQFRRALHAQNRSTAELIFRAPMGIWGSILGMTLNILVLIAVAWVALFPINSTRDGRADVESFFSVYLCLPLTLAFYIPYKLYYRTRLIPTSEIDLDTGRRQFDLELLQLEIAEEEARLRERGRLYMYYKIWC